MRRWLRRWFGLRCRVGMCGGAVDYDNVWGTYWRCTDCGKMIR